MSLTKSKGNMYPWVTHMHTHLGGECLHKCAYCYVGRTRFGRPDRYQGRIRLIEKELAVNYGGGKTIFIEHMNDMFASGVEHAFIYAILKHTLAFPANTYVLQTKNPGRAFDYYRPYLPKRSMIGTTIETNRSVREISEAPEPSARIVGISRFSAHGFKTFITIEPILDFDLNGFSSWIISAHPSFVNIGADSKGSGLPEPPADKVLALIRRLKDANVEIREKHNLERLIGPKGGKP